MPVRIMRLEKKKYDMLEIFGYHSLEPKG